MITEISVIVLGVSLANERILEMLKTLVPWLTIQKSSTQDNIERSGEEKVRRIVIQLISFLTGWMSAGIIAAGPNEWISWMASMPITNTTEIPVMIIGLLSSAGSVFWTQVVSYTKSLKDIKKIEAQELEATDSKNLRMARTNKFRDRMDAIGKQEAPDFN